MNSLKVGVLGAVVVGMMGWSAASEAGPGANSEAATLIKVAGSPKVYIVVAGKKRWVQNAEIFTACGLSFSNVVATTEAVSATLPEGAPVGSAAECSSAKAQPVFANGTLVQGESSPKVYMMVGGTKRWVTTSGVFTGCGLSFSSVLKFPEAIVTTIPDGAEIATGAQCTAAKAQH